jgi:hypothetical protein
MVMTTMTTVMTTTTLSWPATRKQLRPIHVFHEYTLAARRVYSPGSSSSCEWFYHVWLFTILYHNFSLKNKVWKRKTPFTVFIIVNRGCTHRLFSYNDGRTVGITDPYALPVPEQSAQSHGRDTAQSSATMMARFLDESGEKIATFLYLA